MSKVRVKLLSISSVAILTAYTFAIGTQNDGNIHILSI